jgi:hypothetical protein
MLKKGRQIQRRPMFESTIMTSVNPLPIQLQPSEFRKVRIWLRDWSFKMLIVVHPPYVQPWSEFVTRRRVSELCGRILELPLMYVWLYDLLTLLRASHHLIVLYYLRHNSHPFYLAEDGLRSSRDLSVGRVEYHVANGCHTNEKLRRKA